MSSTLDNFAIVELAFGMDVAVTLEMQSNISINCNMDVDNNYISTFGKFTR